MNPLGNHNKATLNDLSLTKCKEGICSVGLGTFLLWMIDLN